MNYLIPNIWSGKADDSPGVGHEFRNWLTGYNIADYYNLQFVHAPFSGSDVGPEDKWNTVGRVDVPVERWENFLNFVQDELKIQDLPDDIKTVPLPRLACHINVVNPQFEKIIKGYSKSKEPVLFKCPFNQFLAMRWSIYQSNRFRKKYWEQTCKNKDLQNSGIERNDNEPSVGVHIRRCDVNPRRYPDRFLSNRYYANIIRRILELYTKENIHIYSDAAKISEFPEIVDLPVTFHLRTDVFETFYALTMADIFVASHGSWAILVSHLSFGVKITRAWNNAWNRFPIDKDIVPTNENGNFESYFLPEALNKSAYH